MELAECMSQVASLLRFFIEIRNYSYVDRISNALTYDPIEIAIKDALRHVRSLYDASVPLEDEKTGKVLRAIKVDKELKVLPKIPSEECVKRVLDAIREDISAARRLAIMALAYGGGS